MNLLLLIIIEKNICRYLMNIIIYLKKQRALFNKEIDCELKNISSS